ncbi:hypothetical protein [Teichococcus rhizosphaerae]|nr:hypothetical protein [Pseudoroseomonas rhizosphaerae]
MTEQSKPADDKAQAPKPGQKPVDEKTQEEAAKEREKTGGYQ